VGIFKLGAVLLVALALLSACVIDPADQAVCDCDLIKGWLSGLPIADPAGTGGELVATHDTIEIGASVFYEGVHLSEEQRTDLVFAMKDQGLNLSQRSSTDDDWHIDVFPGELINGSFVPDEPWVFEVIDRETGGLTVKVNVHVPTEQWGIDSLEAFWDLMQSDRQEFDRIETERQQAAIAMLQKVTDGAEAMR
jgi:hypothetical protein